MDVTHTYETLEPLGKGAFGEVLLVRERSSGQRYALKFLRLDRQAHSEKVLARFKAEFQILAQLQHPHIARIGEFGHDAASGRYFFTAEYIEGVDLFTATAGCPPDIVTEYMLQVLRALEFLHSHHITHFDLKPANILVDTATRTVKVIDFGLANLSGQTIAGTPAYMAPEICLREPRDARADLYAVGVLWYQALTRVNPFRAETIAATMERQIHHVPPRLRDTDPTLPEYCETILARLLAKNPEHRYARAADIIRDLNFLTGAEHPIETDATSRGYLPEVGAMVGRAALWSRIETAIHHATQLTLVPGTDVNSSAQALAGIPARLTSVPGTNAHISAQTLAGIPIILIAGGPGMGKSRLCQEARYSAQLQSCRLGIHDYDHPLSEAELGALRANLLQPAADIDLHLVAAYPADIDALQAWCPAEDLLRLHLAPFRVADVDEYLQRVTGVAEIPRPLCEAMTARTEGNPRLLRELLAACFAHQTLFDAHGRWPSGAFQDLGREVERLPVPSAMGDWFATRLLMIPAAAREVLALLSLCQGPIPRAVIEQLGSPASEWLTALLQDDWITWQDDQVSLRNPALREWMHSQVPIRTQMEWHDRIAACHEDLPEEDVEYHRIYGALGPHTLPACQRFVAQCKHREQWSAAAAALAWTWERLPPDAERVLAIGVEWLDVLIECGAADQVVRALEALTIAIQTLSPVDADRCAARIEELRIEWHLKQGDHAAAERCIQATLAAEDARRPANTIRLRNYLGRIACERGALDIARQVLTETWQAAAELPPEVLATTMNNDLFLVYVLQTDYAAALAHYPEELARLARIDDPYLQARCALNIGETYRGLAQWDRATPHFQQAYDLAQALGRHELTLRALNALGTIAQTCGKSDAAIDYYRRGLHIAQRLGDRSSCAALATNLGILFHESQRASDAFSHLRYADQLLTSDEPSIADARCRAHCQLELAHLYHEQQAPAQAQTALQTARALSGGAPESTLLPYLEAAEQEFAMATTTSHSNLEKLLTINQHLAHATELPELLNVILGYAVELGQAECGLVLLLDPKGALQIEAALNVEPDAAMQQTSTTIARRSIERGAPVITDDASADSSYRDHESVMLGQLRAVCCLPIRAGGKVIGCLYLSHRYQPGAFRSVDQTLLSAFADQAGIAIERTQLLHAARARASALAQDLAARDTELSRLEAQLEAAGPTREFSLHDLHSTNVRMGQLFALVKKILPTDLSVVLHGETGTGKEVIARILHRGHPQRGKGPFVALCCSAIPRELMESELFGAKAGAYTGATRDKAGLFEAAQGGTLFLDEIAELPLDLQAKLLRVLQEMEVRRVGETAARKIDCRVLSATHQHLKAQVKAGKFREDLYYRLCQMQIDLPPLRERREDLPMLIEQFVQNYYRARQIATLPTISRELLRGLLAYHWPGNVRELEHLIHAMCALSDGKKLRSSDLPPHHPLASMGIMASTTGVSQASLDGSAAVALDTENHYDPRKTWEQYEQLIIAKAYQHYEQDARQAAQILGISVAKTYKMIKDLELKDPQHVLYTDPFRYRAGTSLRDYMMKIFTAALLAAQNKPYTAIRNLGVSPGYFYKVLPTKDRQAMQEMHLPAG